MLRLRLFLTLIIAGVLTLPLQAIMITVADAGAYYTSIQAAINAANNGDEIIVSPGTYLEAIDFRGKAITLRSASGDPADTIIDGGGNGRVVTCTNGETSMTVLDGFTITNGSATYGGGMYNSISSPTVTNCTFSGNTANGWGGGMYNSSSSSPTVSHCTFSDNTASYGGGMLNNSSSSPRVTNCTFSGNTADNDGGGMFNRANSSPRVSNCTFSGNTANSNGGGMVNYNSSSPTVSNCTFSGNTADYGGGMVNFNSSSPRVTNCTFSGNTANGWGGGMYNSSSSSPTMSNCILWGDSPDEIYNSIPSTLTVRFSDLQGGLPVNTVDGGGNIDVDPLFVDTDGPDNIVGTEDDNLRLSGGSPCIDAGDNEAVPGGISFDLDGSRRFEDSPFSPDTGNGTGPLVDMGPYENIGLCLGDDISGDSDGDEFCDNIDACPGFDDNLDADGDNAPDDCDLCPGFDDAIDLDTDGVPYGCDTCTGFDDSGPDSDGDGVPDACDTCNLPGDINCDGIVNLMDLKLLALHWLETN